MITKGIRDVEPVSASPAWRAWACAWLRGERGEAAADQARGSAQNDAERRLLDCAVRYAWAREQWAKAKKAAAMERWEMVNWQEMSPAEHESARQWALMYSNTRAEAEHLAREYLR